MTRQDGLEWAVILSMSRCSLEKCAEGRSSCGTSGITTPWFTEVLTIATPATASSAAESAPFVFIRTWRPRRRRDSRAGWGGKALKRIRWIWIRSGTSSSITSDRRTLSSQETLSRSQLLMRVAHLLISKHYLPWFEPDYQNMSCLWKRVTNAAKLSVT